MAAEVRVLVAKLQCMGRNDLLLKAISIPVLEMLRVEAARARLSRMTITKDFRFILDDYNKEVLLTPLQKALYLLFLNHDEGIEFKDLPDHRDELRRLYAMVAPGMERERIEETVNRLTNPLNNTINEICSKIKAAFAQHTDEYTLTYYMVSGHVSKTFANSTRVWFKRLKTITLPRELVRRDF